MNRKFTIGLSIALLVALLVTAVVLADNLLTDGDGLTPVVDTPSLALGNVCTGTTVTKPIQHAISRNGNYPSTNVFANSATVTVSVFSVSGSGLSASSEGVIALPSNWGSLAMTSLSVNISSSITFVAGSTPGSFSGTVNYSASGTGSNGGTLTRDDSLNVTATVVSCDNTPPELTLPANMNVEATGASGAAVTFSATASDTNPLNPVVSCVPASGSTFALDVSKTVNCSATDASGNTVNGSFTVTVVDTTPPAVTPPSSIVVEASDSLGATVTYSGESASDLVDGVLGASCLPISGSTFPLGSNTVTCSAMDSHSNTGTSSFTIDIQDTTSPVLALPAEITAEATGTSGTAVDFDVSASDSVDGDVVVFCDATSGAAFPIGTTIVSCSATDSNGNEATGSFNIVVVDTTAPELTLPDSFSLEAEDPSGAVATFAASAADVVDGSVAVTCVPPSGSTFPLGENSIACSATDGHGNTARGSFKITVVDTTAPTLTLPADQQLEATGPNGAVASFSASATDLVDGTPSVACSADSGDTFPLGTTKVVCSAEDAAGNEATGSFVIIVIDTTAPLIAEKPNMLLEATGPGGAMATFGLPTASDIVDESVTVVCDPASGNTFALGQHTVTCTATDDYGNFAKSDFDVFVQDTTAPTIADNADVVLEATGPSGAVATFSNPAASDIVDMSVDVVCLPASGGTFGLGHTKVTCTATDDSGNSAQSDFDVFVQDTTAPTIADNADMVLEATGPSGAVATFSNPAASDIVDENVAVVCAPVSGSTFSLGHHTVTCTATDDSGNSAQSDFDVFVQDTTDPTIADNNDMVLEATGPSGAMAAFSVPAASDIVDESVAVVCDPASGNTFALGHHTVTCTATDDSGNSAQSAFDVFVQDTTAPTITFVSRTPSNSFGWNNTNVTVTWSCSDIVGVIAPSVSQTLSGEGSAQSATGTCTDTSGNTASDTVDGINIDKSAPTDISFVGGPAAGASYYFGSVPSAPTCTADGAISGLDSCVVSGHATTVGSHTITATAKDKAGNVGTATRSYTVLAWTLKGFYQPVDMNGVFNIVKNGSTVPLKFEIFAGQTELTDTSNIEYLKYGPVACNATAPTDTIETLATGGTILRYDLTGGQFIYNWKTPNLLGCFSVTMKTIDGSSLTAYFKLK